MGNKRMIGFTPFLLTPLREGRRKGMDLDAQKLVFLLTPLREGRPVGKCGQARLSADFYSRPCGRGDDYRKDEQPVPKADFYSRPCGRGDRSGRRLYRYACNFYSRPCGRGDQMAERLAAYEDMISTHAPAGGATIRDLADVVVTVFLLTPLREGRLRCE